MRAGTLLALVVAVSAQIALQTTAARAEDPPLVNWPALLPALAPPFTESTFEICKDGAPGCLDHTLRELRRRIAQHDAACSDNALFARNYRVVTEFYERLRGTGFFQDDVYVAREDAIFAQLYFDAEDAWARGEHDKVAEAWRIAFEAADEKEVRGAGNLLLGINAHVQRDQPFMIAGLGLVAPDGSSRKPDHDKFNELLNIAYDDVIASAVEWDDPDLAMYDVPGTQGDNFALFQIIASWREGVWRNAERLVRAQTDEERKLVAESIERQAAESARFIRAEFQYGGPFTRAKRDALCAKRAERAAAERRALAREHGAPRVRCTARGVRNLRVTRRGRRVRVRGIVLCGPQRVWIGVGRRGGKPRWKRLPATTQFDHTSRRLRPGRHVVRVRFPGGDFEMRRTVRVRR
ncbi:MAG: DUF5995 family protein [Actinomycetota bacterium]|nr:DUF5995 family protein [Actinomycetota bacterium]